MLWVAKIDVPANGVESHVTDADMAANEDGKVGPVGAAEKKAARTPRLREVVFLAGAPSHPRLMHEYRSGSMLLAKCLNGVAGIHGTVVTNGWPEGRDFGCSFGHCFGLDLGHDGIDGL